MKASVFSVLLGLSLVSSQASAGGGGVSSGITCPQKADSITQLQIKPSERSSLRNVEIAGQLEERICTRHDGTVRHFRVVLTLSMFHGLSPELTVATAGVDDQEVPFADVRKPLLLHKGENPKSVEIIYGFPTGGDEVADAIASGRLLAVRIDDAKGWKSNDVFVSLPR